MSKLIDQILGHQNQKNKLLSAIENNRLAPVMLFVGPTGIGKKKLSHALAQKLICESHERACGKCGPCLRVEKNQSESFKIVQPDGAYIKVEQAKEVHSFLSLKGAGRARVLIIDEVEKMNVQTANSLLKILEEPPQNTYFFLIANSVSAVLPTIRSRSQMIRFSPLEKSEIQKILPTSEWILESAQGQLDLVQKLSNPEIEELRLNVARIFIATSDKRNKNWAVQKLRELAADRESAITIVGFWSQMYRDLNFTHFDLSPIVHTDQKSGYSNWLKQNHLNNDVFKTITQSEKDLVGNVDRNLVLTELWNKTAGM